MVDSIHETYGLPRERQAEVVSQEEASMMGRDDFLKILIAQMQNQDPLDPMDDEQFVAQMATFSQLEQVMNMSESIQSFVEANESGAFVQHADLIGQQITWEEPVEGAEPGEPQVIEHESEVVSVKRTSDGSIQMLLNDENETWITQDQLVQVAAADADMSAMPEADAVSNEQSETEQIQDNVPEAPNANEPDAADQLAPDMMNSPFGF
ncbi:flagellar basal-body rod modification protein FlgD [Salsuginibacillus halophilus]|uniref:Basal-body rod modification protein FlgD n=1 Tax=Salsuginibacillus halophilus TaxID=517424 RepID=A0A2P8HYG2_9BACI|nr:flagellar basal-body rod modification protein FlgD [Salsuginibacillus halophilus]